MDSPEKRLLHLGHLDLASLLDRHRFQLQAKLGSLHLEEVDWALRHWGDLWDTPLGPEEAPRVRRAAATLRLKRRYFPGQLETNPRHKRFEREMRERLGDPLQRLCEAIKQRNPGEIARWRWAALSYSIACLHHAKLISMQHVLDRAKARHQRAGRLPNRASELLPLSYSAWQWRNGERTGGKSLRRQLWGARREWTLARYIRTGMKKIDDAAHAANRLIRAAQKQFGPAVVAGELARCRTPEQKLRLLERMLRIKDAALDSRVTQAVDRLNGLSAECDRIMSRG